ncbi:TerB family tellurite resistance protein [Galbibacter pacificus]|uniref:TerB family tellurite resistance protein n=1 Tax=Galbibacter pacificus TaxID=2996052 RepID=A0ABT6FTW2_9FLAO|nr:TerB family tellurite resistance protein [Galbibacter pacificus]MDG3583227.1 TerB family tellurite resistance protein [Galbibacter pacificus]MDG3586708.1 TerB family tellurite resistance protein [Galbibacter pacificus]
MFKWILAFAGYFFLRIPGVVIGFIVGSLIDSQRKGGIRIDTIFNDRDKVSPADFELNLLSLCSIVIKADGKVNQNELQYVRSYFIATYGEDKANAIFKTFNEIVKKREVSAKRICGYLNQRTRYEVRLQLLHFLFGIAQADGAVTESERLKIREIAGYFRIHYRDFESIKAMFVKSADTAYKILEINKNASDADVKAAYRQMVKKYHPDKVRTNDEAIKKGAEDKFKEVQMAYEQIQKERGM